MAAVAAVAAVAGVSPDPRARWEEIRKGQSGAVAPDLGGGACVWRTKLRCLPKLNSCPAAWYQLKFSG